MARVSGKHIGFDSFSRMQILVVPLSVLHDPRINLARLVQLEPGGRDEWLAFGRTRKR